MFQSRHEQARHGFSLPLPAEAALALFTPEGERRWISDWKPQYLHPEDGMTVEGMVFTTGEHQEMTYWTMVDFDRQNHRVRYARVTPASRSTMVQVVCTPQGPEECGVEVTYTLTGLSPEGNAIIEDFVGEAYVAMIES
jgi:hypothetical protein